MIDVKIQFCTRTGEMILTLSGTDKDGNSAQEFEFAAPIADVRQIANHILDACNTCDSEAKTKRMN